MAHESIGRRYLRTAPEEESLIQELLQRFPNVQIGDLLRATLRYGLRAARERPLEVLLGALRQD